MEVGRGVFESPEGWGYLELSEGDDTKTNNSSNPDGRDGESLRSLGVWCTRLEIIIVENRDNGRDCHVRGVRILGPCQERISAYPSPTEDLPFR
ncbi:unnamed protein product [Phytomonas sp. Hart1]|nr:unnamed protein product [Phytomonas sp. Hart1]|eukprot:CCW67576.1 unnamed protein product [Phytomonas sp. isolate Hart1]